MALHITDLSNHPKPVPGLYFFDTNVLIYVMGVVSGKPYEIKYINFFNEVFKIATSSKESRIITTSLQISELFNRLLKIESNKAAIRQKYSKGEYAFYKDVFRKGADITKVFNQFKSDFMAYQDAFEMMQCPLASINDILNFSPSKTDINDYLYTKLVKAHNGIMVTHDYDLVSDNMQILTVNQKIINKSREFTVT